MIRQRSSRVYAIYGNRMHAQMEYWTLTSKNSAKLKRDYYFHAEFLEEVRYKLVKKSMTISGLGPAVKVDFSENQVIKEVF